MDLIQQCQLWNENDEYQKIIEAIEALPTDEQTPELMSELARAYCNLAEVDDRELYEKAVALLQPHAEYFKDDYRWHFRMGYAHYYLQQIEEALAYFKKVLELHPGDEYAQEFIDDCQELLGETSAEVDEYRGAFVGFVLLAENAWNKEQLIQDLKSEWEIEACEEEAHPEALVFSVDKMIVAVSLMSAPIPEHEAEENAANNYLWPQAVETTKMHQAHLLVAVLGKKASLIERGKLFVKVIAACCRQPSVLGVYTSGTVFQPQFYLDSAALMKENELPIFNWIWFGLYQGEQGVCCYTYGMRVFGKDEMEVLDVEAEPLDVRDFLVDIATYVLSNDATLQDGETIGFSADQRLPISRSEGVSLPGMTLKIGYEELSEEDGEYPEELIDCADFHLQSLQEKQLPIEELNAYNHLAIYLRWHIEHDHLSEDFSQQYEDMLTLFKTDPWRMDLREFLREELYGLLLLPYFDEESQDFARYYYGDSTPSFPADIDDYARQYFGEEQYHSEEFEGEAYLFIPYGEEYYQKMAQIIDQRWEQWQHAKS